MNPWMDQPESDPFEPVGDGWSKLIPVEPEAEIARLRAQNKASSDAWTRRVAQLQRYRDNWENMRRLAHHYLVARPDGGRWLGYSAVQEAQVAEGLAEAERRGAEKHRRNLNIALDLLTDEQLAAYYNATHDLSEFEESE